MFDNLLVCLFVCNFFLCFWIYYVNVNANVHLFSICLVKFVYIICLFSIGLSMSMPMFICYACRIHSIFGETRSWRLCPSVGDLYRVYSYTQYICKMMTSVCQFREKESRIINHQLGLSSLCCLGENQTTNYPPLPHPPPKQLSPLDLRREDEQEGSVPDPSALLDSEPPTVPEGSTHHSQPISPPLAPVPELLVCHFQNPRFGPGWVKKMFLVFFWGFFFLPDARASYERMVLLIHSGFYFVFIMLLLVSFVCVCVCVCVSRKDSLLSFFLSVC